MRKIVAFSEACHTSQETVTVCVICNHSASQDIISPSKCRHQTSFPPLEVIQLLVHALVSCGKCHILFKTAIVILLAPLTKRHLRHHSGFSLFCIVWCICTTQRVGVGAWGNEYLEAKADGQASWGRAFWNWGDLSVFWWCPVLQRVSMALSGALAFLERLFSWTDTGTGERDTRPWNLRKVTHVSPINQPVLWELQQNN